MAYSESRLVTYREYEINSLRPYFKPGARVLELGGGNGWQAQQISQWGCDVSSIDVNAASAWGRMYFQVTHFDGRNIPFGDEHFDLVFSSNVLEHVEDLQQLLKEVSRVLKPSGLTVNVMPTSSWRIWTNLSYYLFAVAEISRRIAGTAVSTPNLGSPQIKTLASPLLRQLIAAPHGTDTNSVREILSFSRRTWLHRLRDAGFTPTTDFPLGVFYTGYMMVPAISFRVRKILARLLGAPCRVYVCHATKRLPDKQSRHCEVTE